MTLAHGSPAQAASAGAHVTHQSSTAANVGRSADYVPLYDARGRTLLASHADVESLLAEGYSLKRFDPQYVAGEVEALLAAATPAVSDLAELARSGDFASKAMTTAFVAAEVAMRDLTGRWDALRQAVAVQLSPDEGEPVTLWASDGSQHHVDPSQVALFRDEGHPTLGKLQEKPA